MFARLTQTWFKQSPGLPRRRWRRIHAQYTGADHTLGYHTHRYYTLDMQHRPDGQIRIRRLDGTGERYYSNLDTFKANWIPTHISPPKLTRY